MPKFNVRVKGILNARGIVEVEANSREEALKKAEHDVEWGKMIVDWRCMVVCSAEAEHIQEKE